MTLKFSNGIEIVIDDDKIVTYEIVNGNTYVNVVNKDETGICRFKCDIEQKKFYELSDTLY